MQPALGLGDARVKEAGDRTGEVLARRLERVDEDDCGAAGGLLAEDGAGRGRGTRARQRDCCLLRVSGWLHGVDGDRGERWLARG